MNDVLNGCGQSGTAINKIWRSKLFRQLAASKFFPFLVERHNYCISIIFHQGYIIKVEILYVIITLLIL